MIVSQTVLGLCLENKELRLICVASKELDKRSRLYMQSYILLFKAVLTLDVFFFTRELRGQLLLLISFPRVAHSRCICTTEKALCGLSAGNVWVECAGSEHVGVVGNF